MALVQSLYLYFALSLFVLVLRVVHRLNLKYDPREPPVIPQKVPYFGHLIGLISQGHVYLERLSKKHNHPIYTLQALTKRIYVVCSLDLVLAVQRDTKKLSLNPFIVNFIPRMFELGEKDMEAVALNHDGDKGDWGYIPESHHRASSALAPGPDMNEMVRTALNTATSFFDDLKMETGDKDLEVDLYGWTQEFVSLATTQAVYGPENPFRHDPRLVQSFWEYDTGLTKLLMGISPKLIAPKAHSARRNVASAMYSYYSRNGQDQASALVRSRYEIGKKAGISLEGISNLELGDCMAVLVNATPAVFWMIWHIYSAPVLLQDLRLEVQGSLRETIDENGKHLKLNIGKIKSHCPQLFSTYQEVLRVRTHSASHRWVLEDTLLSNSFLMKKGNVVEMPGHVIHANTSVWGPDVNDFNPRRFMQSKAHNVKLGSLRAFGGGKALCPGRHFATTEIMSVVALMILRFDIVPSGSQAWVDPQCANSKVASVIPPPASDIKTVVAVRDGYRDVRWGFDGVGEEHAETAHFNVA